MGFSVEFLDDPHAFVAAAADLLAGEPVRSTVVASVTARFLRPGAAAAAPGQPRWWAVVRDDDGTVVSAAMRTAPLPPFAPYLLAMPGEAAVLLARTLHGRGEAVEVVNGFLPAIEAFATELAALLGGELQETERTTLYELTDLVEPTGIAGSLRLALPGELDLVQSWFDAFGQDASEQAGRAEPHPQIETRESTAARIGNGEVWVWQDASGAALQVTGFNPPSFGVARVGPVYTPKENRGHGYAAAAVAAVSRQVLGTGARVCLFADGLNTTSTGVYVRLGYRPVAETGGIRIGVRS